MGTRTRGKHAVKTRMRSRAQRTLCATRCIWTSWVHEAVPAIATYVNARVCALGIGAETRGQHVVKTRMRSSAQRTLCATRCIWSSWVHNAVPEIVTHLDARVRAVGIGVHASVCRCLCACVSSSQLASLSSACFCVVCFSFLQVCLFGKFEGITLLTGGISYPQRSNCD